MNARDALEVVRQQLETLRNLVPDIEADSLADTALAGLSNLVERAGEPVAYISPTALDALNKCRNDDHNGIVDVWMRPNDALKATIPLYTAPGASHER